jgi:hypothetical protein
MSYVCGDDDVDGCDGRSGRGRGGDAKSEYGAVHMKDIRYLSFHFLLFQCGGAS